MTEAKDMLLEDALHAAIESEKRVVMLKRENYALLAILAVFAILNVRLRR